MSTRTGREAIAWGRSRIADPSAPTSTGNWFRWCKVFVRLCFNVPSDGTPDAGKAWDRAKKRHRQSDPSKIPAGVPVFWELPSVADHVALSTGNGRCLSNDIKRSGRIDEVPIDLITRSWGGVLLGWTEDIDGVTVWQAPAPEPEPEPEPRPNRIQRSRAEVWDAIELLDRAIEKSGRGKQVKRLRKRLRRALRAGPKQ